MKRVWSALVTTLSLSFACALGAPLSMTLFAQGPSTYTLAPAGNEARYRVREQLVGINFPSDAIGKTSAVTGVLVLEAGGKVVTDASTITVDLRTLASDSDRRDRIIQNSPLQTAQHPNVVLRVRELRGLRFPWPTTGEVKFDLVGDLTLKGVTKPTTWQVTAQAKDGGLAGTALTSFTFTEFGMERPRGMSVLTVEDLVKLEYDFHFIPKR